MKNTFLICIACMLTCASMAQQFVCPPFLQPGDTVAIISPSYTGSSSSVVTAETVLRQWGYVPLRSPYLNQVDHGKLAGTVDQRASDLTWALYNPSVKAIMASRGGYGSVHLLGPVTPEVFEMFPKWIIGYSDITSLLNAEAAVGVMGIHGAMTISFASHATDSTCILVRDILRGQVPDYQVAAHAQNRVGTGRGRLVGGNLCTFYPLVGTEFDPTLGDDGIILFMEEVGENFHTIDRMVNMLRLQGVFPRLRGVILGDWASCSEDLTYGSVPAMLSQYFSSLNIPVCCGFHAGHGSVNLPLITGAMAELTVTSHGASIHFCMEEDSPQMAIRQIDMEQPYEVYDLMGNHLGQQLPDQAGAYVLYQGAASKVIITH